MASAWHRASPARAERHYRERAARLQLTVTPQRWHDAKDRVARTEPRDAAASRARAADAIHGRFTFLDRTVAFERPIDWAAPKESQLWRYKLQYGGYLVDLAVSESDAWPTIDGLLQEWISANPLGRDRDTWHPFVVSERVVNWILAIILSGPETDRIDARILESLATQAVFVDASLEEDVGGNHLLKNFKAMAIAGCFWTGAAAEKWYRRYTDAFTAELTAQLLADGAHYERSPMYHVLVLEDALELAATIRAGRRAVPTALASAIRAMTAYLPHVTHPDGEIALFNDSVLGEAPAPAAMRAFSSSVLDDDRNFERLTVRQAVFAAAVPSGSVPAVRRFASREPEDSGLVRIPGAARNAFVLFDVGRACPDDLPAHAHADFFSFELSLDGQRLITDSGVGEYESGTWREYYRSTRAHNTVTVDGLDQIECWGSFRVARRAKILARRSIEHALARGVMAMHDGYRRLAQPVSVSRTMVELAGRGWLVLDRLDGAGVHRWGSYVHAAPGVEVAQETASSARLSGADCSVALAWFGFHSAGVVRGSENPKQGWFASEFGRHVPSSVLELRGEGSMPAEFGYVIVPDVPIGSVSVTSQDGTLMVDIGTERYSVRALRDDVDVRIGR